MATRDAMRARGPDGYGSWWSADRRCALGHRRLSILDLSDRAAQPMVSENDRCIVTFNGEIYNFPELRLELEAQGARFRTTADTEALLHLYARHGESMVHKLRGMFAFAIWDDAKRGLFLARDPYGIKPLYTANDGWTFRFASQVKALLAGGQISRDPEPAGFVGFHLFGSVPEPFTFYREIRALPAGHTQWIDATGPREPKSFASIAAILAEGARQSVTGSRLTESIRAGVLDSVRAHLLADVDVGVFLSAGIDSGALLGLMKDAGQSRSCAVTLAFDEFRDTPEDEAPLAAKVAAQYGAKHIIRRVNETEFESDLPAIFEAMDQPSIDGVNTWFVAKAAKEAGLKVALSGLGGDEVLAGYPSFTSMPRWHRHFGLLASIPGLGRAARGLMQSLAPGIIRTRPKAAGLLQYADTRPGLYLLQRGLFLPHELSKLMDHDLLRDGMRRLRPFDALAASLIPNLDFNMAWVTVLESTQYLRNQLLRDADWAGMAHGIEIRVPFVDTALLSSVAPWLGSWRPGDGKIALSRSPSRPLPHEVVMRAKTGFAVPTGAWMAKAAGSLYGRTKRKGLESREWSRVVLSALTPVADEMMH